MSDPADDPFAWEHATIDGKYEVDAVVGRGGFGVVYGARHLGFGEKVAVKCLRIPQTLSSDERSQFQQSFLAEGRLLHQLSRATAGIVQALDVGTAVSPNGTWTPFLVLEWLEGRSLEQDFTGRRKDGVPGRTLRESIQLMDSAVRALEVAHSQGIAHRDIKPANLFITEIGGRTTLKVLDFGIAKVVSDSESMTKAFEATGASLQAFTARYGAPEQFSRRYGSTGPWTDVFALTLVLIEMVIGRSPLDGSDAAQLFISAADTLHRPTLRTHGVETSDAIEAVLKTALSVDPKERYPSAGPFWDALIAAVEASGEAGNIAGRSRSPSLPLFSSTSATRVDGPAVEIVPAGDAPARTELTSSTPSQRGPAPPPTAQGSRRVALITAGVLSLVSVIVVLLFHAKSGGPPDGASSPANSAAASNSLALTGGSAPEHPPVPAPSAPSVPNSASAPPASSANAAIRALPGFPSRDIPAGTVEDSGAWLDKFSVLEREGGAGLNLADAFAWVRRCAANRSGGARARAFRRSLRPRRGPRASKTARASCAAGLPAPRASW
jgi:serine/threonine-protein kinase